MATENTDNSNDVPDSDFGIEFGQVEQSQPSAGLRPDHDRHYAVTSCGEIRDGDLSIYVDMDVLRDMESHARENTGVELGGVMLGQHHVDGDGIPFVVVTDSLRARHYEATRGSFKFTHDTWNQITRERNEFRGDLEMVGWYHTHPGWGVFLSGMDQFICNNFFNRPLDVALVIDPCAADRGWFQWSESEPVRTRQVQGFHLMTNRHRRSELNYFSAVFSNLNQRNYDPRFQQASVFDERPHGLEETMVNQFDSRRSIFEFAIVSMLVLQLLVVGLIGWRLSGNGQIVEKDDLGQRLNSVESRLALEDQQQTATIREETYAKILDTIVTGETGQGGLAEKYAEIETQNRMLNENLAGQLARAQQAINEKKILADQLSSESHRVSLLENDLIQSRQVLEFVKQDRDALKSQLGEGDVKSEGPTLSKWILYTLGGLGLVVLGGIGGFLLNRMLNESDDTLFQNSSSVKMTEAGFGAGGQPSKRLFDAAVSPSESGSGTD